MLSKKIFDECPGIDVGTIVFDAAEQCSGTVIEVYKNWADLVERSKNTHKFYTIEDGEEVEDEDFFMNYLNLKLSDLESGDLEEKWVTLCNCVDNIWWAPESQLHIISSACN